ncbi:hypothetical protein San01_09540 [Streptomyces angustmyceticus]|uniref:Uncharacterized protein n=1 Tax=Streptomyces angustmyceticus TaxID=285578 RepID=A0A5J4L279_9ACTN|nr:hypothetical protein San01_09540 [Streptomyces angustmyceticus]
MRTQPLSGDGSPTGDVAQSNPEAPRDSRTFTSAAARSGRLFPGRRTPGTSSDAASTRTFGGRQHNTGLSGRYPRGCASSTARHTSPASAAFRALRSCDPPLF